MTYREPPEGWAPFGTHGAMNGVPFLEFSDETDNDGLPLFERCISSENQNVQYAPFPTELEDLVSKCTYRKHEGWQVDLLRDLPRDKGKNNQVIGRGLTLSILTKGYDTYNPDQGNTYRVYHYFIVPAATYNRASWTRWLFECFHKVELHECMENFIIDGERPFAPLHGPGDDPYTVHEAASVEQVNRRFSDVSAAIQ